MTKIFTAILCFFLFITSVLGQSPGRNESTDYNRLNEVLPPSPGAAALGKFGGINFGLASGAMSHNIPLVELNSANLSVGVSLNYNTTGFKVDEVATKVGTSWSLNAGGVITRMVRGAIDERSKRLIPPDDFPQRTRNLINFMEGIVTSNENGPNDTEHDVFSFNFLNFSGQFILDDNKEPVLLSHSGIKIEKDFFAVGYNFLITTPDGVKFYFGGDEATEKTSKISGGSGCGKSFRDPIPTAWYLNKIIHPDHDTIYFTYNKIQYDYKAGISQTLFSYPINVVANCPGSSNISCAQIPGVTCVSKYLIHGIQLKEMTSTTGSLIKFKYTTRQDGLDSLLSAVLVFKPNSEKAFKIFEFEYFNAVATKYLNSFSTDPNLINRPFLIKLIERTAENSESKSYGFIYNDIFNLPPRLSFAQDHYGYFNGKSNQSLIPEPKDRLWKSYFHNARANREADPEYASKGLLTQIKYPTGGEDQIVYGGHTTFQKVVDFPPDTMIDVYAQGKGNILQTITSELIEVKENSVSRLQGGFYYDEVIGGEFDPKHHYATVYLVDIQTERVIFQKGLGRSAPDLNLEMQLSPGLYRIQIRIRGTGAFCGVQLYYQNGQLTESYKNVFVGGVRVEKVISNPNSFQSKIVKRYFYSSLNNLEKSSGVEGNPPVYENYYTRTVSCTGQPTGNEPWLPACVVSGCSYYSMFSNSQNNLFIFPGSPVYYSSVVESFGEDFENGGKEYHFLIQDDLQANSLLGKNIVGAPYSDYSWNNGKETFHYVFKKQADKFIPVKKVFTSYKMDDRKEREFKNYIVSKRFTPECVGASPPNETELGAYDLMSYSHFQKWIYIDTIKTFIYNQDGQHYLAEQEITEYYNPIHALSSRKVNVGSDGKELVVRNFYPHDLSLSGDEEFARRNLIEKHMISPVLRQQYFKAGIPISKSDVSYGIFSNGLVLPRSYFVQMGTGPIKKEVEFFDYNIHGKLLQQAKQGDIIYSYIYDFANNLPVAQVVNATTADIAYAGFEADGKGYWDFSGLTIQDDFSIAGSKCYSLQSGNLFKSGLDPNKKYLISFWVKGSGQVNVSNSIKVNRGETKNGWTFFEHIVSGTVSATLSGSGVIDEVRLYPVGSQMITFTYDPIVGVTSKTDENNQIIYYQYDSFGRLSLERDSDKNILKRYDYRYVGSGNGQP